MEEQNEINEVKEADIVTEGEDKKMKNMTSIVILLAGLLIGSLFVDVVQLIKGEGFSQKKLQEVDVVETAGKTWVAYTDPTVSVDVITDEDCESCDPGEVLVWLRRVIPTVAATKSDVSTEEGQMKIEDFGVKTLPAFVFGEGIQETDFYQRAQLLFSEKDGKFVLNTSELGLPVGRYLALPEVGEEDIQIGNPEAKVTIVEYSDFQCPFCARFHESANQIIAEFGDQINFVYKHLPLNFHLQAENAALASECANEQGKFLPYADKLFADQENWGETEGTSRFKTLAVQVGLNGGEFNSCMDEERYAEKIAEDAGEAREFGISGTPSIFINDQFKNGVISFEEFKAIIDEELAK